MTRRWNILIATWWLALLFNAPLGTATLFAADAEAARVPLDLDAELSARLTQWAVADDELKQLLPENPAQHEPFTRGYRQGVADVLNGDLAVAEYRGSDPLLKGHFIGKVFACGARTDIQRSIVKRLENDPTIKVSRATDLIRLALGYDTPTLDGGTRFPEHAELLIKRGANPNAPTHDKDKLYPLHLAVEAGNSDLVELLLKRGANANASDAHGWTALFSGNNRLKTALLLKHRARVNVKSRLGLTPLHAHVADAFWWGADETIPLLIAHGADIHARDKFGRTPLHLASSSEAVDLLIERGARADVLTNKLETPLHFARGSQVVEALVRHGVDIHAVDHKGNTALHSALGKTRVEPPVLVTFFPMVVLRPPAAPPRRDLTINLSWLDHTRAGAVAALVRHGAALHVRNIHGDRPIDHPLIRRINTYIQQNGSKPTNEWVQTINTMLVTPIPIHFEENQLVDITEYIRRRSHLPVIVDWPGMVTKPHTTVNLKAQDAPADEVLTGVLASVRDEKLTWRVDPYGVVLIGTPARLEGMMPKHRPPQRTRVGIGNRELAIVRKLNLAIPAHFEATRLDDVLGYLHSVSGLPVRVDWPALKALGVRRDARVTLSVASLAIRRVADLVLHQVAGERAIVHAHQGALFVSTPKGMAEFVENAMHDK